MNDPEHVITTPDGLIMVFYDPEDGRRTISYIDLSGEAYHLGTTKDGKFVWGDGT